MSGSVVDDGMVVAGATVVDWEMVVTGGPEPSAKAGSGAGSGDVAGAAVGGMEFMGGANVVLPDPALTGKPEPGMLLIGNSAPGARVGSKPVMPIEFMTGWLAAASSDPVGYGCPSIPGPG